MMHKVYVYGTLMPNDGRERVSVPGRLYDLGWFPGARLGGPTSFTAEIITATDEKLEQLDRYEGYYEKSPSSSLYIRRPYLDGWIYEYNRQPNEGHLIASGDWQKYKADKDRDRCIRDSYKYPQEEVG